MKSSVAKWLMSFILVLLALGLTMFRYPGPILAVLMICGFLLFVAILVLWIGTNFYSGMKTILLAREQGQYLPWYRQRNLITALAGLCAYGIFLINPSGLPEQFCLLLLFVAWLCLDVYEYRLQRIKNKPAQSVVGTRQVANR